MEPHRSFEIQSFASLGTNIDKIEKAPAGSSKQDYSFLENHRILPHPRRHEESRDLFQQVMSSKGYRYAKALLGTTLLKRVAMVDRF